MTEDDARKKWCPMVRLGSAQDTAHADGYCWNNRGEDSHDVNCIASDCAVWKWTMSPDLVAEHKRLNKKGAGQPGRENKPWSENGPYGHCGLMK